MLPGLRVGRRRLRKHGREGLLLRSRACAGLLFAFFYSAVREACIQEFFYSLLVPVLPEREGCARQLVGLPCPVLCEGSDRDPHGGTKNSEGAGAGPQIMREAQKVVR